MMSEKLSAHLNLITFCLGVAAILGVFVMPVPVSQAQGVITATPFRTATPTETPTPTVAPTVISTLIPGRFGGDPPWTPPAPTDRIAGHFLFRRPFDDVHTTYWARSYSYGSTKNGQLQVHHGLDFPNPAGTPIVAAGDGTVYYAGKDIQAIFGPQPDFYGNVVVIEHSFMFSDGRHIYTLYGHMRDINVQTGQQVKAGDVIGYVGSTGVALGAHTHFEVRIGDPGDYNATSNPELWIVPYPNMGVVAGRVMDIYGDLLEGIQVEVQSDGVYFAGISYAATGVNRDQLLQENYVVPDVPAGYQTVFVRTAEGRTLFRKVIYVWAGQITQVDIHIQP